MVLGARAGGGEAAVRQSESLTFNFNLALAYDDIRAPPFWLLAARLIEILGPEISCRRISNITWKPKALKSNPRLPVRGSNRSN